MYPGGPNQDLQPELEAMVVALERGFWRKILFGPHAGYLPRGAGSADIPRLVILIRQLAASMEAQALGHLDHAWQLLQDAVRMLPRQLTYQDPRTGETRAACGPTPGPGLHGLIGRAATVTCREQTELAELRDRFAPDSLAPGRVRARTVLIEAAVQFLIWIEHDRTTYYPLTADPHLVHHDRTTVDRDRRTLLYRATLLRQFAEPRAGDITPPVWQDIGKWRGLRAAANHSLGLREQPSCCPDPSVPVRDALIEAWETARKWLET
jgi:hypothetical protein